MTRGRWLAVALGAALALLLARAAAVAFVEYRWYEAFGPGFLDVWRARAVDLLLLRVGAAAAAGAFLYLNLLGVASTIDAVAVSRRLGGIEIAETVPARRLRGVLVLVSVLFGIAMALPVSDWVATEALLSGHALGEIEPYTRRDLAFFLYWLPFENGAYAWALVVVAFVAGAVIALYALTPGLRWARGRVRATVRVRRHLALFGVAILLLLAWGHRLDAYALLVDGSGAKGEFTGLDELALLPARFGLAILSALAAVVVLRAGWAGQARLAFWAVTAVVLTTIVGRSLAGPIASVALAPERLTIANGAAAANRALYTRRAFAADQVRDGPDVSAELASAADVAANTAVWDAGALARAAAPTADARSVERTFVGWQLVNDTIVAAVVTPRPVASVAGTATLAGGPRASWRATLLDPRSPGLPVVKPRVAGPAAAPNEIPGVVYPGASDAAVVRDAGPDVVGEVFGLWPVRLANALAARDLRLLRADDGDGRGARLVRRRDPRERVQALLPFFAVARDASPVVAGDSVWWAVSVLAASSDYPLAEHLPLDGADASGVTRLRFAGTALVNAATGFVQLVAAPDPDADIRAWYARFPRLFTRAELLPPALAAALPVPYDAALAQAYVYAEYGSRSGRFAPGRRVQTVDTGATARYGGAFGSRIGAHAPAVATAIPLVSSADAIAGVVVATGGAAPRATWVPAPATPIGARWQDLLDSTAAPVAAPQATLGNPAGAREAPGVVDGALHVVPTTDGPLFVRSQYVFGADNRPSIAATSVVVGGRVLRGPVLRSLVPGSGAPGAATAQLRPTVPEDRLGAARGLYGDARRALQRGDWGAFGRALDDLGRVLGGATSP